MPVVEEPRVLPAEDGSATRGGGSRSDVGGLEEEPRARIRARMLGDSCAGWSVVLWLRSMHPVVYGERAYEGSRAFTRPTSPGQWNGERHDRGHVVSVAEPAEREV